MRLGAAIAVTALLALAGCGGSEGADEETTTRAETPEGPPGGEAPPPNARPIGPPKAKESIKDAEKRIARTVESEDCDVVNELNPISREPLDSRTRCKYLQRLDGLPVLGSDSFGGAGVIDYRFADRVLTALLIVDTDGLYHVALFDPLNPKPSVGTKFAKQEFGRAVDDATRALADSDCDAYIEVAHRRFGRGARPEKEICELIEPNPVQAIRSTDPDAKPEPLGGNASYAFYMLGSPGINFTLVLGRQTDAALPEGIDELPKGSAEYAYIDAYLTNRRAQP
jgi:hypothetical protein